MAIVDSAVQSLPVDLPGLLNLHLFRLRRFNQIMEKVVKTEVDPESDYPFSPYHETKSRFTSPLQYQ